MAADLTVPFSHSGSFQIVGALQNSVFSELLLDTEHGRLQGFLPLQLAGVSEQIYLYAGTNASVYIKDNEVTVEDATGQNICRQGKRIRGVVGDFGQGVGNGYYVEKSMTELRNLTRQEWQTRLAGQMVSTGTELQVTSYEELRSFIQEELGELFEEDVQK